MSIVEWTSPTEMIFLRYGGGKHIPCITQCFVKVCFISNYSLKAHKARESCLISWSLGSHIQFFIFFQTLSSSRLERLTQEISTSTFIRDIKVQKPEFLPKIFLDDIPCVHSGFFRIKEIAIAICFIRKSTLHRYVNEVGYIFNKICK